MYALIVVVVVIIHDEVLKLYTRLCKVVNFFRRPIFLFLFLKRYSVIHNSIAPSKELCSKMALGAVGHGGLYRWRENSLPIFLFQKLKEILTWYSRTILKASKN